MSYRHTQIGYVTVAIFGMGLVLLGVISATAPHSGAFPALIVLGIAMVFFATLTTTVEPGALRVWFGPGLIRRRIDLSRITDVRVARNPWYCGWGIRWIGHGWLWNVSGFDAVEIELDSGRRFRIGTDEPELLARALRRGLEETKS